MREASLLSVHLAAARETQTGETKPEQRERRAFGNGLVGERKVDLENSRATATFGIHQLERERTGRSGVRDGASDGRRRSRIEAQIDASDDQRQAVVMGNGEHLPRRDRHESRELEDRAYGAVVHQRNQRARRVLEDVERAAAPESRADRDAAPAEVHRRVHVERHVRGRPRNVCRNRVQRSCFGNMPQAPADDIALSNTGGKWRECCQCGD